MNIGRYDGNNSAERVHWTKTQSNTCNLIFNTQKPTGRCKFCVFFLGTLKLGFCPIITIITSGFHFSCREYIFLFFFFLSFLLLSLCTCFVTKKWIYLFCISLHLNENCMETAMHWIIEKLFIDYGTDRTYPFHLFPSQFQNIIC